MDVVIYKDDLGVEMEEIDILEDMKELVVEWREKLVELVVEIDEELMMKYFEGEEFIIDELKVVIRKVIIVCEMNLVFCGIVYRNKGV